MTRILRHYTKSLSPNSTLIELISRRAIITDPKRVNLTDKSSARIPLIRMNPRQQHGTREGGGKEKKAQFPITQRNKFAPSIALRTYVGNKRKEEKKKEEEKRVRGG